MGAAGYENPYNSRESPYVRLIFTQHTIWPLIKEFKNIDGPISFAPLIKRPKIDISFMTISPFWFISSAVQALVLFGMCASICINRYLI